MDLEYIQKRAAIFRPYCEKHVVKFTISFGALYWARGKKNRKLRRKLHVYINLYYVILMQTVTEKSWNQ
jgi:hypothetical protein